MVLTFNEAVDYLKGMFPSWDRDALSAVLSANEGRMGRAIDEILFIDSENAKLNPKPTRIQSMRANRPSLGPVTPKRITIDGTTGQSLSPRSSYSSPKKSPTARRSNPNYRNRVENNVVYRGVKFILPSSFLAVSFKITLLSQLLITNFDMI